MRWPVIHPASGETSSASAPPMSSGRPTRPSAVCDATSTRVRALEAELGVRLLQRTTPDGEQLLPRAERLVADGEPELEYRTESGRYAGRPMRSVLTVNSTDAYRTACLAGLGIIQVPRIGVRALIERGALVEILREHPCAPMPVQLVHPHGRSVAKRVRAVMSWLAAIMRARLLDPDAS